MEQCVGLEPVAFISLLSSSEVMQVNLKLAKIKAAGREKERKEGRKGGTKAERKEKMKEQGVREWRKK